MVHLAVPRTARRPVLDHPPVKVHRFSAEIFAAGLDGVVEALRAYRPRGGAILQRVLEFARICRVEAGMPPYLEATA